MAVALKKYEKMKKKKIQHGFTFLNVQYNNNNNNNVFVIQISLTQRTHYEYSSVCLLVSRRVC